MTAPTPQPDAERAQGDVNQGIGWYEFITPAATTRIAYVGELGYLYLPEGDPDEHFHLAAARGNVHRLIRADALDVEKMARVLFEDGYAGAHSWEQHRATETAKSPGVECVYVSRAKKLRAGLLGGDA